MTTQEDIGGVAGRDQVYSLQLFLNGKALNLNGYTPSVVVKASRNAADESGTAYAVGTGLTVTAAALGKLSLTLPAAATATPGTFWYRCDVSANSQSFTAAMGNLVFIPA